MKFWKRRSAPIAHSAPPEGIVNEQAVLVHLDGTGLPKEIYDEYDVATLEDCMEEEISVAAAGEYDGNEFGQNEVVLFMY